MPINFHIGASEGDIDWSGKVPYTTWPGDVKHQPRRGRASSSASCAGWSNLLVSDVPERHPNLKFVSVESRRRLDPVPARGARLPDAARPRPNHLKHLSMKPSEYFRRQFYGCSGSSPHTLKPADRLPRRHGRIMFETDFPHPTCLYPHSIERAKQTIGALTPEVQKMVLQDNAARLYGIDLD